MQQAIPASKFMWFFLGSIAIYFLAATVLPYEPFREILYALALGVCVVILFSWTGAAWNIMRKGEINPGALLALSVWMTWVVFFYSRALAVVNLWYGRPQWLYDSPLLGLTPMMIIVLGALQLVAAGRADDQVPGQHVWQLVLAVFIGGVFAGLALSYTVFRVSP